MLESDKVESFEEYARCFKCTGCNEKIHEDYFNLDSRKCNACCNIVMVDICDKKIFKRRNYIYDLSEKKVCCIKSRRYDPTWERCVGCYNFYCVDNLFNGCCERCRKIF